MIRYTIDYLTRNGFELISVPDILPENVIKACGMETETDSHHAAQVNTNSLLIYSFQCVFMEIFGVSGIST